MSLLQRLGLKEDGAGAATDLRCIDLHTHVLPGIDDGASDLEETIEMLRLARATGTRRLCATPHMFQSPWNNRDPDAVRRVFDETLERLHERSAESGYEFLNAIELVLGAENLVSPELLEALPDDRVLTLNASRYLLIEFPLFLPSRHILEAAERVRDAGLVPLVAHVERYFSLQEKPARLAELRELGCLFQVTLQAVTGRAARDGFVQHLVKNSYVDVLASDTHGPRTRPPILGSAAAELAATHAPAQARRWLQDHPAAILDDRSLDDPDPSD